jgi:hypothetical protein
VTYADPSHLDLCDAMGVEPCCGAEIGDCRCEEDAELTERHPVGCLCHADEAVVVQLAPARQLRAVS